MYITQSERPVLSICKDDEKMHEGFFLVNLVEVQLGNAS